MTGPGAVQGGTDYEGAAGGNLWGGGDDRTLLGPYCSGGYTILCICQNSELYPSKRWILLYVN